MRAFSPIIALCAVLVALTLQPAHSLGAGKEGFATIKAGSLYTSTSRNPRGESTVELYVLDKNFFVLRQIFSQQDKPPFIRDLTGTWRQVDDGAMLRLTNRHGLTLGLNIGGGGNLYGDFFPLPGAKLASLILKKTAFKKNPFFVMGTLERSPKHSSLTDSASGRVFAPLQGEALLSLPEETPLFVDAELMLTDKGARIKSIRSFSKQFPQYGADAPTLQHFKAEVEGTVWTLPPMPGLSVAGCTFQSDAKGKGVLEITGKGVRLRAEFTLVGDKLTVAVGEQDARTLQAQGAETLLHMLQGVRAWNIEGGALVLLNDEGQSVLLEKAQPRGQARPWLR